MTVTDNISAELPTRIGDFTVHVIADENGLEHIALAAGTPRNGCIVRIHSECATGDIFGSLRCDCRDQLDAAMEKIADIGEGLVIYLRGHEGRGIGLANKIRAYALQEQGMDTAAANEKLGFAADARDYTAAVDILRHFDLSEIRLITNNTRKIAALESAGIKIAERLSAWTAENPHNARYIETKKKLMGHFD